MKHARPYPLPVRSAAVLALGLACLAGPAAAQRTSREIRSDIEFARGLASEWQFVDMADDVIRTIENDGVSSAMAEELGLVKCDIFAEGARYEFDPVRKAELYERAVGAYVDFLDRYPYAGQILDAKRNYVDVSNAYAGFMAGQLEDAAGAEATALRSRIDLVLGEAVKLAQKLIDEYGDLIEEAKKENNGEAPPGLERESYILKLNRGQMLLLLGRVAEDGTFYYTLAQKALESLALEAGERSYFGLWAYLELGRVYVGIGELQQASDFFEYVLDQAIPQDADQWQLVVKDSTPDQLDARWTFAQLVISDLLNAFVELGKVERATKVGLHYYNKWRSEGFNMKREGWQGVLAVARVLVDAGGIVGGGLNSGKLAWYETDQAAADAGHARRSQETSAGFALTLALQVNSENRGNRLQVRAQKLISDMISRPGVDPGPSVLFEAAEGEYFNSEFAAAANGYKRVLASLASRDAATRAEFGAHVYNRLGETYQRMDRPLEAAMAFREGIEKYNGDALYDPGNAKGYLNQMKAVRRDIEGSDPLIEAEVRKAENLVTKYDTEGAGNILFLQAQRLWDKDQWVEARAQFQQVPLDADSYEKAKVYAAVCSMRAEDFETATSELEDYVLNYVNDTAHALTSETRKLRRKEALGMARFYLGQMAGKQKDYASVFRWLDTFHIDFPSQTEFAPTALYYLILAHLAQGDFDAAKAAHDQMLALYPDHSATGNGAYRIYRVYEQRYDEAREAGDKARAAELGAQMARYVKIRNDLASSPDYGSLRKESQLWGDLENWVEAERVLREIQRAFGSSPEPEMQEKLRIGVLPDLGQALARQRKLQEAVDVLAPLVPDPDDETAQRPTSATLRNYCMALAGWVEDDGTNLVDVPGLGGAKNLETAVAWWNKLTASLSREKWTDPWYESKFMTAYAYYRWGQEDSSKLEAAKSQVETLKVETGDDFALIAKSGPVGAALARRFAWLDRKLR